MATVDDSVASTISDHALRMLKCFMSGLDDVVYEIAEQRARRRLGGDHVAIPIAVEAEDVQKAAQFLAERIKKLVKEGELPPGTDARIDQMVQCCQRQAAEEP